MTTEGKTHRILVVDDDANTRAAMARLLDLSGYVTSTAADGRDAVAVLDSMRPDVVVTDLRMPRMGGVELVHRLRHTHRDVPVIVVTVYGASETVVAAMGEGAVDYLEKPVDIDALVGAIETALSSTSNAQAH